VSVEPRADVLHLDTSKSVAVLTRQERQSICEKIFRRGPHNRVFRKTALKGRLMTAREYQAVKALGAKASSEPMEAQHLIHRVGRHRFHYGRLHGLHRGHRVRTGGVAIIRAAILMALPDDYCGVLEKPVSLIHETGPAI